MVSIGTNAELVSELAKMIKPSKLEHIVALQVIESCPEPDKILAQGLSTSWAFAFTRADKKSI
jgi:hypothetical protein